MTQQSHDFKMKVALVFGLMGLCLLLISPSGEAIDLIVSLYALYILYSLSVYCSVGLYELYKLYTLDSFMHS